VLWGHPFIQAGVTLKIQVHGTGVRCVLRPPRLGLDELGIQRIGKPRYDLVLHVEQIGDRLVEALGPKVSTAFDLDELCVHAKPLAATLDGAFQHIADLQLAADLPEINRFAFVGECGVPTDDESAAEA
jgi:hypothetical protein